MKSRIFFADLRLGVGIFEHRIVKGMFGYGWRASEGLQLVS